MNQRKMTLVTIRPIMVSLRLSMFNYYLFGISSSKSPQHHAPLKININLIVVCCKILKLLEMYRIKRKVEIRHISGTQCIIW